MSTTLNAKLLMKKGSGTPGTSLELGEFGYDSSNKLLYVGNGVGSAATGFPAPDVNKAYVDGSLGTLRTDVSNGYAKISGAFTTANATYTASASDNNNFILVDTSALTITFPNTLSAGFATTVVNETTGIVTLNASTLLSQDSSVVLRDRYAAATVICKSAGVFLAIGNLK